MPSPALPAHTLNPRPRRFNLSLQFGRVAAFTSNIFCMKKKHFAWIALALLLGLHVRTQAQTAPKSDDSKDALQRMLEDMESRFKAFSLPFPELEEWEKLSFRFDTLLRFDSDSLGDWRMPRFDFFFDGEGDWGAGFERLFELGPLRDFWRLDDGGRQLRDDGGQPSELLPEERLRQEEEQKKKSEKTPKTIRI